MLYLNFLPAVDFNLHVIQPDLWFLAGEGEVAVDESLFQDLDDLELEDEFDEDFGDEEGLSD